MADADAVVADVDAVVADAVVVEVLGAADVVTVVVVMEEIS